jgi:PAS domain S-box-containing protein
VVGHLLPFIVVLSVLGSILVATVRLVSDSAAPAAALVTLVSSLALIWLVGIEVRDHRELTAHIESRDSQMVTILDGLPIAVMLRGTDGTLLRVNPGVERFLERPGVDVSHVSSPSSLLEHVEVVDEGGRPHEAADLPVVSAIRDASSRDATLGYALPGGGYACYAIRAAPVSLSDDSTGTVVTCDDVTERHEARQRAELAERSLRRTFDHAPIGIAVLAPDGRLLQVNAALCDLLGYNENQLLADGLQGAAHPPDPGDDGQRLAVWLSGAEERYLIDRHIRHASGRRVFTQMSVAVAVVRSDDGTPLHLIAQIVDLTKRRALEQELRAAALKDPLTSLPNRRALLERLTEAQQRRARGGGEIGLLYLDLDRSRH